MTTNFPTQSYLFSQLVTGLDLRLRATFNTGFKAVSCWCPDNYAEFWAADVVTHRPITITPDKDSGSWRAARTCWIVFGVRVWTKWPSGTQSGDNMAWLLKHFDRINQTIECLEGEFLYPNGLPDNVVPPLTTVALQMRDSKAQIKMENRSDWGVTELFFDTRAVLRTSAPSF